MIRKDGTHHLSKTGMTLSGAEKWVTGHFDTCFSTPNYILSLSLRVIGPVVLIQKRVRLQFKTALISSLLSMIKHALQPMWPRHHFASLDPFQILCLTVGQIVGFKFCWIESTLCHLALATFTLTHHMFFSVQRGNLQHKPCQRSLYQLANNYSVHNLETLLQLNMLEIEFLGDLSLSLI